MAKRPLHIMVAENDEDDRALVTFAFADCKSLNYIHFVEDGEQLLTYLNQCGPSDVVTPTSRPDLILLDLDMPKMNGHEALRAIKGAPHLRSIPVVIFTTSRAVQDINSAYNVGANSFINKPSTYEGMVQAMTILTEYWAEIAELPLPPR